MPSLQGSHCEDYKKVGKTDTSEEARLFSQTEIENLTRKSELNKYSIPPIEFDVLCSDIQNNVCYLILSDRSKAVYLA